MNKFRSLCFVLLLLSILGLGTSCISRGSYEALEANLTNTQAELVSTQADLANTQAELTNIQANLADARSELTSTQVELVSTQADLASTQAKLDSTKQELSEVKAVYPLKNFPDLHALEEWLAGQPDFARASDDIIWYQHALELQESAARDGYLVSATIYIGEISSGKFYMVYCLAVVGDGDLYVWDPDTKDIHYWLDVSRSQGEGSEES